ncbi:MAG: RNA polymerase sigma factor [Bacteroidales bacterium]|jgi:RNA polymerase sigma factor, sigma-70 family|nr:RNA polymerase sigma factor [Coprobacter sp.]CDA21533.1 rNA polymerase sigma factor [Bacteroides sp. CAG:144]
MKSNSEDTAWITRCVLWDDRRAFAHLVDKYQVRLRRFLLHLTGGDSDLADDLAQDTFLRAYERIRGYKGLSSFPTWLFRIACNLFYDYNRQESRGEKLDTTEVSAMTESPAPIALQIDVARALASLRPDERMALTLFYLEDMPIAKIAVVMERPEGSVKTLLFRGKQHLSEYFKQDGYGKFE